MSVQDWKGEYRFILDILWKTPRVLVSEINLEKGMAGKRLKEALEQKIIVGPDIRKRSYKNTREYIYFVNCDDPELLYLSYRDDPRIIYHAEMIGACNLWLITKEKIDIEGEVFLEGYRSDYITSYPPDHTWETAMEIMRKKIQTFNPRAYIRKGYIQTHFDETIPWDESDEILYRYFKYDLRKPFSPIMKEHKMTKEGIYQFLGNLPQTCTVATSYYPDTLSAYDPYLFMFETDYEDFIIDLFSELPTSASFFKISNKLLMLAYVPQHLTRGTDIQQSVRKLSIPLLVINLLNNKIIGSKARAIVEFSWANDI